MNEYTVQIIPSDGEAPYYLRFTAPDEATLQRFMNDPGIRDYIGRGASFRIALTVPWF